MQIKQENDGHAVIDQLTGEEVLTCAINIGEQLLMSGAEIKMCIRDSYGKKNFVHCGTDRRSGSRSGAEKR